MVVQAGAGTGKTTTLKMLAGSSPSRRGLYLAFNRSIAKEAEQQMPASVRAKTAHALAFADMRDRVGARMNADRVGWGTTIDFLDASPLTLRAWDRSRRSLSAYQVARLVIDTVKGFCQSADEEIGALHIPAVPGLATPGGRWRAPDGLVDFVLPRARRAWEDICLDEGVLAYDHGFYLKRWALGRPVIQGDYLMFDEAQDAAPVIAAVVNAQSHMQKVFVGDTSQQIMAWAGAVDAMEKFAARPGVVTLSLTESFRFGPVIATAANDLLDRISAPLRITGSAALESRIAVLDGGGGERAQAVLCRTNAGSLDEVLKAQNAGRSVCLLGGAVELRKFVEAALELQTSGRTNFAALMAFESWDQVVAYVAADPDGSDLTTMVELVEEYGIQVLLRALERCVSEAHADVVVSTAHKAKGREWDAVRIAGDFTISTDAPVEVLVPEMMLAYVALTRAKRLLDPGLLRSWLSVSESTTAGPAPGREPSAPVQSVRSAPVQSSTGLGSEVAGREHAASSRSTEDGMVETPFDAPGGAVVTGPSRYVAIPLDVHERLVAAAHVWGGSPDGLAARLLAGVLDGLVPPTKHHSPTDPSAGPGSHGHG